MRLRKSAQVIVVSVLLSLVVAIIGCENKSFVSKIAEFQEGMETTTAAVGIYYSELNDFDIYSLIVTDSAGRRLETYSRAVVRFCNKGGRPINGSKKAIPA